ncbi:MAG: hypothetical protein RL677_522 [Actinomycetota bacterium]
MNRADLNELRKFRGTPVISILAPTHRHAPENQTDPILVKNLINEAKAKLLELQDKREAAITIENIDKVISEIDWENLLDGVAIYANGKGYWAYDLPFSPQPAAIVEETFAVRELVRALNRSYRYRVLALSESPTRLFLGDRDRLVEIRSGFPLVHDGPGGKEGLPTDYGQRTSVVRDENHRQFFRKVGEALKQATKNDPAPLFITGVDRYISFWNEVAPEFKPAAVINGSFDYMKSSELATHVWPEVERYFANQRSSMLERIEKSIASHHFAGGVSEVFEAANQSRIELLIAPEDAMIPTWLNEEKTQVNQPGDGVEIPDVVDETVERVLDSGGSIMFLPAADLEKYGQIAAILRY